MVATVVNDLTSLLEGDRDIIVVYFYCKFNRQENQRLEQILAVLIRQLFQERFQIPDAVTALYEKHRDRATRPAVDELTTVLRVLISSYNRVFLVIDALDECGNSQRQRDRLLDELVFSQSQKSNNVNILIITREIPEIMQRFPTHPQIEIRADKDDIKAYLTGRMCELPTLLAKDIKLQEEINEQITDAAKGMFLLAKLQFDSLRDKTNRKKLKLALSRLKSSSNALDSAYDDAVKRIELQLDGLRELARKVFLWITYAVRELSIHELREAIAVEPGETDLDLSQDLDDQDQIVSACQGLVVIDEESQIIRLVHYTTQEYLEKVRDRWLPAGHSKIVRSCLAYMSLDVFEHKQCMWEAMRILLTESTINVDLKDYDGRTALASAVRAGYTEAVQLLLVHPDTNVNSEDKLYNRTPLSIAAAFGYTDIVAMLLAQPETNAGSKDRLGRTPLLRAVRGGQMDIILQLLARPDVNANSQEQYGWTPLSMAAELGHTRVVEVLLSRHEINADSKDRWDFTPLSGACREGHTDIVQLLLARPEVFAGLKDNDGRTPLSIAAEYGHTDIVPLLLNQPGVDVDAKTDNGDTPLSLAAKKGYTQIVQLLENFHH